MRYGFWTPVFGGWLRNVPDEGMAATWDYTKRLCQRAEQIGAGEKSARSTGVSCAPQFESSVPPTIRRFNAISLVRRVPSATARF